MQFIDAHHDLWHTAGGEDGPISHPPVRAHSLLTLQQWHAVRAQWPARDTALAKPVGVMLAPEAEVECLAADIDKLDLVVLQFPKWTDGRAYSQARLLRARLRFRGQVRASGDVLADMLPLLARTGFDAVVLRTDQDRAVAERALGFFGARGHYQGDVTQQPHFARGA